MLGNAQYYTIRLLILLERSNLIFSEVKGALLSSRVIARSKNSCASRLE